MIIIILPQCIQQGLISQKMDFEDYVILFCKEVPHAGTKADPTKGGSKPHREQNIIMVTYRIKTSEIFLFTI